MSGLLSIDGVSYFDKVIEGREFKVHIRMEDGTNNFISSEAKVTLINDSNLQNIFLNNSPYSIYQEGYVEISDNAIFSFPFFKGYIDKQAAPVNLSLNTIELTAVGLEKNIADRLSEYDISRLYQGGGSRRQRWGRDGEVLLDPDEYSTVENYVTAIFEELGYASIIHIPNSEKFKYKYNQDKFGAYTRQRPIAIIRNISDRGRVGDLDSDSFKSPGEQDRESASFNSLLKDFAKITGCIYFYDATSNVMCFFPRDYNFNSDLTRQTNVIDDFIVDDNPVRTYGYSYNAISVEFDDITLVIKFDRNSIVIGGEFQYGILIPEGTQTGNDFIVSGGSSDYVVVGETGNTKAYRIGGLLTEDLFANNALKIKIDASIGDYLEYDNDLLAGDSIKEFLDAIYENYEFVFDKSKTEDLLLQGIYLIPMRVQYEGDEYNVFEGEFDLHRNETRIKFDR